MCTPESGVSVGVPDAAGQRENGTGSPRTPERSSALLAYQHVGVLQ